MKKYNQGWRQESERHSLARRGVKTGKCLTHSGYRPQGFVDIAPFPIKNKSGNTKYDFFSDAGHGWLKVPYEELVRLEIADKITGYSYVRDGFVYLEEDSDATKFVNAKKARGETVEFRQHTTNRDSKIRSYESYQGRGIVSPKDFGGLAAKGKYWTRKPYPLSNAPRSYYWQNKFGDTIDIVSHQDRDGNNDFVYQAFFKDRSSLGRKTMGKTKVIARGRNENVVRKKAEEFMKEHINIYS